MESGQFTKYWFILQYADLRFHLEGAEGRGECGAVKSLLPSGGAAKIKPKNIIFSNNHTNQKDIVNHILTKKIS